MRWFIGEGVKLHPFPDWKAEVLDPHSNYNGDEGFRALPLKLGELLPGFPKPEHVGKLRARGFVELWVRDFRDDPRRALLPVELWLETVPKANVTAETDEDWWEVAKEQVKLGLCEPIEHDDIFEHSGQKVLNLFFAVPKRGRHSRENQK